MVKTIYIAGKVTGEPLAECTMKFGAAQKEIETHGHKAINPLEVVGDWKTPWHIAMRKCVKTLADCDAIILLPDYHKSKGAMMEEAIASDFKLDMYYSVAEFKKNVAKIEYDCNHNQYCHHQTKEIKCECPSGCNFKTEDVPVETCCKKRCNNPVYEMRYCFDHYIITETYP